MARELATVIRVTREGDKCSLTVDGVEFPWHLSEEGPSVDIDPGRTPSVTLSILAERVEVVNTIDDPDA